MARRNKWDNAKPMPQKSSIAPLSGAAAAEAILAQARQLASEGEYRTVPIDEIALNPANSIYNENDTPEAIERLARSIERSNGLLHNLVVVEAPGQGARYRMISGERRLRALRLLRGEDASGRWNTAYCLVKRGLSEQEELLLLDAANLETRGSAGDEKAVRKAISRYVENIKEKYGVDDAVAVKVTQEIAAESMNPRMVQRNLAIERRLHPSLLALLDAGRIPKRYAERLPSLAEAEQERAGTLLTRLAGLPGGESAMNAYVKALAEASAQENTVEQAGALERAAQAAQAAADTAKNNDTTKKRATAAANTRDGYLARCDAMQRQLNRLTGSVTVENIRRFDSAPGAESIRDRLAALRDCLDELIERIDAE